MITAFIRNTEAIQEPGWVMKNTNNWYIGPVSDATLAEQGFRVTWLLTHDNPRKVATLS
jgi:hypothetical protein